MIWVAAGAVVVGFLVAGCSDGRRTAGTAARFESASAVLSGAWSLRFDLRRCACGVESTLGSSKRVVRLVVIIWTGYAAIR